VSTARSVADARKVHKSHVWIHNQVKKEMQYWYSLMLLEEAAIQGLLDP